ncbi:Alpha/Beta hydrolase protein [Copromyces sp. CBS 386.78]|nr:Alpha/Beta hydrolase protein [Copromyces sp. CBS 386.78]
MESLFLQTAPPLDPAWLAFEEESGLNKPHQELPIAEHQVAYAAECRSLNAKMLAPGARDHHLSLNVAKTEFTVPSAIASPSVDEANCYQIPVIRYQHAATSSAGDSAAAGSQAEEQPDVTQDSLSDCLSVLNYILNQHRPDGNNHKLIIAGSSSGGQLVGLLSQHPCALGRIHGVLLRCPVTSDAFSGLDPYVPLRFRLLHTSAWDPSFWNSLLGQMKRGVPRDGLERMPLEADETILKTLPRTWIQLCTNDSLYSDGLCYAKALEEVGVEVKVDVVRGWPHTFWLKAPGLERALGAEEEMVRGLGWLLG